MEKARLGRWHNASIARKIFFPIIVEMEKARLGRRHHLRNRPSFYLNLCKNERTDKFPSVFSINTNEVYYYWTGSYTMTLIM